MSSCKFEGGKCHGGGETSGYLRHNDITPENRKRVKNAKEKNGEICHIDPAKSHLNKSLTGYTYEQAFTRYKSRIAELDEAPDANNKRKDRVTLQAIEVPVPADLSRDKYNDFMQRVLDIMVTMYGAENLVDANIHWDEEHEYIDSSTSANRTSRVHGHFDFVPAVDGKLNAKQFSKRSNINKLNQAVEKMCVSEFDCHFHTGQKTKSKKTVQELKDESKALQEQAEKQAELAKLQLQLETIQQDIAAKQLELDNLPELEDKKVELDERETSLNTRETNLDARETALNALKTEFKEKREDFINQTKKWNKDASTSLQTYQTDYEDARDAYKKAKTSYEVARDQAEGISLGFTTNDIDTFCSKLGKNMELRCKSVKYTNGKTLWDYAGTAVMQALSESIADEKQYTPEIKLQEQEQRVQRAETMVKGKDMPHRKTWTLPDFADDYDNQGEDQYTPG